MLSLLFMFLPYCQCDFGLLFQAPFTCNIIIISWKGKDINGVFEEHGCIKWFVLNALFTEEGCALNALFYGGRVCIKCLVLRREKTVLWFACTHMVTRIKLW